MATLPSDRSKLALAQSNQVPNSVIASAKNINAIVEVYDTVDLLNQKVDLNYGTGAIGTNQLATDSVTLAKMANSSVGTTELVDSSVTLAKMADASVGTTELIDLSVTTAKIALASVGVAQLSPGATVNESVNNALITALTANVVQRAVNVKSAPYNAIGDGVANDLTAIQNAFNYAYLHNLVVYIPSGTYKLSGDLIIKTSFLGYSRINTNLLFDLGYGFTNFELDGSVLYSYEFIENITIESDKTSYWNATNAGAAYDAAVAGAYAKRVYGQRVYIGNKTASPNNITPTTNKENPNGFWENDYSQWNSATGLTLSNIPASTLYTAIDMTDTNILAGSASRIINCAFIGFGVGLTFKGAENIVVDANCTFERCNMGIRTVDGGTLPGALSSSGLKCTTITIKKGLFYDISFCGVYGDSLLQSKIDDNIFEPCKVGVILIAGAQNRVSGNYHEISYIGTCIGTNNATDNDIIGNYANSAYTTYNAYAQLGVGNSISKVKSNLAVFVAAGVTNSDFDDSCTLTLDPNYFWANGNSKSRDKPKTCVMTFTGVGGTSITTVVQQSTRTGAAGIKAVVSQAGLHFSGNETILSVDFLTQTGTGGIVEYYLPDTAVNTTVIYLYKWNGTTFVARDLRVDTNVNTIRVTFLENKI